MSRFVTRDRKRWVGRRGRPSKFRSYVSPQTYIKGRGQTGEAKPVPLATATVTSGLQLLRLVIARLRRGDGDHLYMQSLSKGHSNIKY
ncbi:hypothetical protein OPV22_019348 [Ensete ventricosum]|uniref:Uncharacterized protein n=1 Tax=Ensete ventricosum TaxID=4639 RepID=A0AAV8PB26_ENSVE|nr:hypothetical protein OPV22_019348 [Ensete ventricosum]